MLKNLLREIKKQSDPKRAKNNAWFFKTGKGQYGEGDKFAGLTVPRMRKIATLHKNLSFAEIKQLLDSPIHEHRFIALEILVMQFEKAENLKQDEIINFYLNNANRINNWDLVDTSAPYILGEYLLDKNRQILYKLAVSENMWQRRIAIVSTAMFIKNKQFQDTVKIAEILLNDKHDLIHKAVGWMLREVGKQDKRELIRFLDKHYRQMPRTMLRYSIERLDDKLRHKYLKK